MKVLLISATGGLALVAAWSLASNNAVLSSAYIIASGILLGATALGGIIQYNLPESQDTRDIVQGLKERNKILTQKVSILQEAVILTEKETLHEKRTTCQGQHSIKNAVEFF